MADTSFATGDVSVHSEREGEGGGQAEETSSDSPSEQTMISQELIDLRTDNQRLIAQLDSERRDRRSVEEQAIEILKVVKTKYDEKLSTMQSKYERKINDLGQQLKEMIAFKKLSDPLKKAAACAVGSQCGDSLQSIDSRSSLVEKIQEINAIDEECNVVKELARRCYDAERDGREKDLVEQVKQLAHYDEIKRENSGLMDRLNDVETAYKLSIEEKIRIEAEKEKLESELKECQEQLASSQMKNSATSKTLTELAQKYEAAQLCEKELMKDIDDFKSNLKTQESLVEELRHTCDSLKKAREEIGKEASEFEALYIAKVDECEKLAAKAQKLQESIIALEDELKSSRQELKKAEQNKTALKVAMDEKEKGQLELKNYQDKLASCQIQNSETLKKMADLKQNVEDSQRREKKLLEDVESLKSDLEAKVSVVEELRHTCDSLKKTSGEMGKEASEYERLYIGKVDECEKLAAEAQKLRQRITTLEDELKSSRQELKKAEQNKNAHKLTMEEKIRLESEKEKVQLELKNYQDKFASCQIQNSEASKKMADLEQKLKAAELREKKLLEESECLKSNVKTQECALQKLRQTCDTHKKTNADIELKASENEKLYIEQSKKYEKLAAEAQKLRDSIATLEDELNASRKVVMDAEKNKTAYQHSIDGMVRMGTEKEKLESELKKCQDQLASCRLANSSTSKSLAEVEQKLQDVQRREKKLLAEIESLKRDLNAQEVTVAKLRGTRDNLKKTIADMEKKASECNIRAADSKKLRARIATVESDLNSSRKELDVYKKRVKELEASIVKKDEEHKKELEQIEWEKQNLEAPLEEQKEVSRKCYMDVASTRDVFGAKKREMEAIDEESIASSGSARKGDGDCDGREKDLVAQAKQLPLKNDESSPSLTGLEKWKCYEELKRENKSLVNRLKEAELNKTAYKIVIEEKIRVEAENKRLQLELKDCEDKLANCQSENSEISKSMADLAKKVEAAQLREKQLLEEIGSLKKDVETEKSIVEKLRHTCDTLKKTSGDIEKQASEYETLYFNQVGECEKLAAEAQKLRESLTKLEDELNSSRKDLDSHKKKVKELEETIVRSEEDHKRELEQVEYEKQNFEAAFEEQKEVSDKYYEDVECLRYALEAKKGEVEALRSSRSDLEQELLAIKEEAARHITELNALRIKNHELCDALDTSIKKFEKSEARLESAIMEFEAKEDHFKTEKIKMKETINQQLKLIDFLQNKSENKHKKHWFGINSPSKGAPLSNSTNVVSIKDIESALVKEREKNQRLIQEIEKTKEELERCFQTIKAYETHIESLNSSGSEQNVTSHLERITVNKNRDLMEKSANKLDSLESQSSSPSAPPLFTIRSHHDDQLDRQSTSSSLTTDNNEFDKYNAVNQSGNSSKKSQIQNKENRDTSEFSFTNSILDEIGQY